MTSPVPEDEFYRAVEDWAARVLRIYSELSESSEAKPGYWGPFDLVGTYHQRERLERLLQQRESPASQAADELLKSFSEDVGLSWVAAIGLDGDAGSGWWWRLVPRTGPLRAELAERIGRRSS